jgi:cytidylate kinase
MPAITISREIGSLGDSLAEKISQRLGYKLVDKNIIEKIFLQYGMIDFLEVYEETGFWARFNPQRLEMMNMLNQVILGMAYHGNVVLLGRGGFALLKTYADVLNLRIQAPFDLRTQRLLQSHGFASLAQAEEFIRDSDAIRRDFVNSMYAERWDSVSAFDLVIDTAKIPTKQAIDWVEQIVQGMSQLDPAQALTTKSIQVDPVLADSIIQVLGGQTASSTDAARATF